ncbi:PQQ-dependent sugar dehydrogenase [Balneolales bacterium ANBcel1]|nr:PQQ-dependent sugar dehydrogenase [Balneolales bacterium ANBcel1]
MAMLLAISACSPSNSNESLSNTDESESWVVSSQYTDIRLTKIAGGLEHPWSLAFLPDGRMLVTERPGRLNILDNGEITSVDGLPDIHARGQGGLMEVSLHPDYESNGWIYLTYSRPNDQGQTATALARARLDGNNLIDSEDIFIQNRYSQPGRHYGSKLAWDHDGKLLMSIGDRGSEPPRAQDLMDHAGTLLRLNDDGTVPPDNPFVGDDSALDEIFTYGNRNIQGLIVHPETGEIWATEHGPRGGDELNLLEAGKNYGWPTVTLGLDYRTQEEFPHSEARHSVEGMTDPVYELLPTHAPSGLAHISGDHFTSRWDDNLLAGGLRAERIRRLVIQDYEVIHDEELILQEIGRIRDVRVGPDGNIYVLTDHPDGGLYRLEPGS